MTLSKSLLAGTAVALIASQAAFAQESCSVYPTGTADKIDSTAVEAEFGPVPGPKGELRFAYVTKTLINEFWQDVAAGVEAEASTHGIAVDVQAAKDESSMIAEEALAHHIAVRSPQRSGPAPSMRSRW